MKRRKLLRQGGSRGLAPAVWAHRLPAPPAVPEVAEADAQPLLALAQGGRRVFLVRIDNPAGLPGRLAARSPQALPTHGLTLAGIDPIRLPTTRGGIAQRWLLAVHNEAPLPAALEPLPLDYKLLLLYARDAGQAQPRIDALMLEKGLQPGPRYQTRVYEGTGHHEDDCSRRLHEPLTFLLGR